MRDAPGGPPGRPAEAQVDAGGAENLGILSDRTPQMFASPAPRSNPRNAFSSMYRKIEVETAVPDASPHRLVAMLYDGLLECISQACGAIRERNVESKGRAIGRAVRIVDEGLKAALNLRDGGQLATDLNNLYSYITQRLTQANLHSDEAALQECTRLILPLREAWSSIGSAAPR